MGVLTQYLLQREDIDLKAVELDGESVDYLLTHFAGMQGRLLQADYLRLDMHRVFQGPYCIIGNFPYNISSQIFFKILDDKDRIPEVVCMIQKEVAERIAEKPGSKTYGILSVLLQAWYDIEYCFTVGPGAFAPPPKVQSAVIRLTRNSRTELGCDEKLFKTVVKTAFNQRRKTLRNSLKPLIPQGLRLPSPCTPRGEGEGSPSAAEAAIPSVASLLDLRAEKLSVEDFVALTGAIEETQNL
jgi:16S rRNA (adenine1518-N6/adenine1519-N6)-dimethyltransferase